MKRRRTPAERLEERLAELPDVERAPSQHNRQTLAFWIRGREFLHFHGPGEVDIRVTKEVQRARREELALRDDPRVIPRRSPSDWVTFQLGDEASIERAFELARLAHEANG